MDPVKVPEGDGRGVVRAVEDEHLSDLPITLLHRKLLLYDVGPGRGDRKLH